MNIAICDDEFETLKSIAKITEAAIISKNIDAQVTLVTQSQDMIYEAVKNHEVDVVFLDINFHNSNLNGIDFGCKLRKVNKDFKLIFMTAHLMYVTFCFECKTFDFVTKPIDEEKINAVLTKLVDNCSDCELGLFKVNKDYMIRAKDILFIERNKSKATVYTKDCRYETCSSLNTLERELPNNFVRIHRSYIVNKEQISKISLENKSIYFEDNLCCPLGQFNKL